MGFEDRQGHHIPQGITSDLAIQSWSLQGRIFKAIESNFFDFPEVDMPANEDELFNELSEGSQDADADDLSTV